MGNENIVFRGELRTQNGTVLILSVSPDPFSPQLEVQAPKDKASQKSFLRNDSLIFRPSITTNRHSCAPFFSALEVNYIVLLVEN